MLYPVQFVYVQIHSSKVSNFNTVNNIASKHNEENSYLSHYDYSH